MELTAQETSYIETLVDVDRLISKLRNQVDVLTDEMQKKPSWDKAGTLQHYRAVLQEITGEVG